MTSPTSQPLRVVVCLLFGLTLCTFVPRASAQTLGAIGGTVTDQTGTVLQGAEISVKSPALTASSNEQGRFYINDLAPGAYNLTITYVGLDAFTASVTVNAGQTANIDAQLHVAKQGETVVVLAGRDSAEAEAINVERTSDNLMQVMPSEVITSLPNANLADALGRLPSVTLERDEGEGKYVHVRSTEPRLTNTTVDGVNLPSEEPGVRQIKFDAIPSGLVDSVQISKTLQANMEGDGIGGSVNLVTKTATDTPTIEVTGLGGYTPIQSGRGNTTETGTFGRRFGASKKFGFIAGGSYDWEGRGIDDIEPVPDENNGALWFDGMSLREYQYFRSRYGFAGSTDYRIRDGSNLFARFLYSDFKNYGDRWAYGLQDNTPGISGSLLAPGNQGGTASYDGELRNPDIQVGSLIIGGNHVFNTTWYSWEANIGRSSYGDSPSSDANFNSTLNSSNCEYNQGATKDQYLPQWNQACFTEIQNPATYTLASVRRDLGEAVQLNLGVGGSGAWQYHVGNRSAVIEYGGRFRNEHKYADTYKLTLTPNGTVGMTQFPNRLINHNYYNGGAYQLGYNVSLEDVLAYADANPSAFTPSSTQGVDPSAFSYIERVSAGYVMNTIDSTNRMRFIVGLRAETTNLDVHNLAVDQDTNAVAPNAISGSYYTVLPSASLRFDAGHDSYVRLIYARGLSRPDPQDISESLDWSVNCNGSNPECFSVGNANLKAETGDDVDVLFDHYLKPFGIISVGYFYKSLHDPIVQQNTVLNNYLPATVPSQYLGTWQESQPVNAGSAWLSGVEASYMQHYTALPGFLGGLGLEANYSYIGSSTNGIPGRSDHPRLLDNSPNMFNISPTYDKGRYSLRMGISYNQASVYAYQYADGTPGGVNGPLSDIYFYSHIQVDAQGIVGIGHGLSVVASGLNLNNEVFGFYQGSTQYMIQREYYQPTFSGGLRWTPTREEK